MACLVLRGALSFLAGFFCDSLLSHALRSKCVKVICHNSNQMWKPPQLFHMMPGHCSICAGDHYRLPFSHQTKAPFTGESECHPGLKAVLQHKSLVDLHLATRMQHESNQPTAPGPSPILSYRNWYFYDSIWWLTDKKLPVTANN